MKKSLSLLMLLVVCSLLVGSLAFAAAITFEKTLPSATHGTLGVNQRLEMQKAAMEELRTKMENWATFSGYSARSGR